MIQKQYDTLIYKEAVFTIEKQYENNIIGM